MAPWEGAGAELAPLDGFLGARDGSGEPSRGASEGRTSVGRVSRHKPHTGITRVTGPGSKTMTLGAVDACKLDFHPRAFGPAFTAVDDLSICPLVSLHPGASRCAFRLCQDSRFPDPISAV